MAIAWSVWASSAASSAKSLAVSSEVTWTASTSSSSVADAPQVSHRLLGGPAACDEGGREPPADRGRFGQPQAALAPHDPGNLLDQVLLGRAAQLVLDSQCLQDGAVLGGNLPGQHGVPIFGAAWAPAEAERAPEARGSGPARGW